MTTALPLVRFVQTFSSILSKYSLAIEDQVI